MRHKKYKKVLFKLVLLADQGMVKIFLIQCSWILELMDMKLFRFVGSTNTDEHETA